MLDKSPVLTYVARDKYFDVKERPFAYDICEVCLREVFDLPKEVKKIQFKAYSRPGKWRVKVTKGTHLNIDIALINGKDYQLAYLVELHALKLLQDRKAIYVECEYA